ncbi:Cysteine protease atg4c [Mortierella sp. GBA43]|nr:Cysteine protease atg4c [Mortierella sp. GBA43]
MDPRPVFSRTRSHQALSDTAKNAEDSMGAPKDQLYRHQYGRTSAGSLVSRSSYGGHAGAATPETDAGTGLEAARSGRHHSSTMQIPQRRVSHSRSDVEFWASLYAQHPVYTRQGSDDNSDAPSPTPFSPTIKGQYSTQVKIWQVLTKTDLPDHHHHSNSSSSSPKKHGRRREHRFQFERLPIKAPQSSKTALSSNGQPFSIVFFFTIECPAPPAPKQKFRSSSSRSKATATIAPPAEPTTLWYQETAFTRVKTAHERTELMGTFLPNGASTTTANQQESSSTPSTSPLYIYETQKLDIEQPKDEEDTLLLDLKLMGSEGSVYAEFSYTFVKGDKAVKTKSKTADSNSGHSFDSKDHSHRSRTREKRSQTMAPVPEQDTSSLRRDRAGRNEFEEGYEEVVGGNKGANLDSVSEEPDAGEHLMQATSQFFSRMGYWLYNSKVVQYIARDERVRTKTAFPAEDIWMLGECYTFAEPLLDEKDIIHDSDYTLRNTSSEAQEPRRVSVVPAVEDPGDRSTPPIPISVTTSLNGSLSPKIGPLSPDRSKYSNSMSPSRFANSPPQRSAATSFVSCQEAQSHSHSRSASASTSSTLLDDTFKHHSASPSAGSIQTMSPPGSPQSIGSSAVVTGVSKLNLNPGNQQSTTLEDRAPTEEAETGTDTEHDSIGRKSNRRRITISGLFSKDSNAPNNGASAPVNNSDSVSALKSLMNSSKNGAASARSRPTSITVEAVPEEGSEQEPTTPPTPAMAIPISITEVVSPSMGSMAEARPSKDDTHLHTIHDTLLSTSPSQMSEQVAQELAPSVSITEEANPKRERKRKTGRSFVSNHTGSERAEIAPPNEDLLNPKPTSLPLSSKTDYIPRTSSPLASPSNPRTGSFFSSRRQSTLPITPVSPKPTQDRVGSSGPASPLPGSYSSSPGSTLRRSWRSLSLSLASSAKSALPFSLRSPGAPDPNQLNRHHSVHEATGFGHEYDFNDFDSATANSRNSLITLPPSLTAYMSLLRPSPTSTVKSLTREQEVLRQFMMDFQSRFWFTYRKDIARIEPSFYTCDSGWGCMMRTGQSLLAQAFVQVLLGREWRAHMPQTQYTRRRYLEILGWFVDDPEFPYSIHRIAKAGLALDKRIGEWFGPSTVAHAFQRLSHRHEDCPLSIMVPMDGAVRVSSIVRAATHTQASSEAPLSRAPMPDADAMGAWKPVLLLIPARFGLDKLTERYIPNLKQLFRIPQFLGIAGGRPGRSLYFVACQGNELFYYDPHFVKPRVTSEELGTCPVTSFHCSVVRSQDINELDPSMLLGFLIQSYEELQDLQTRLGRDMEKTYPLFTIQDDTMRDSKRKSHMQVPAPVPSVAAERASGYHKEQQYLKHRQSQEDRRNHGQDETGDHQESATAKKKVHYQDEGARRHVAAAAQTPEQQGQGGGLGAKMGRLQEEVVAATPASKGQEMDDAFSIKSLDSDDDFDADFNDE